jgi:hypothetical protein
MKRVWVMMMATAIVMTAAYGQETAANAKRSVFSAGGGAFFTGGFSYWGTDEITGLADNRYDTSSMRTGLYGFFDAKYAEVTVDVLLGKLNDNAGDTANTLGLRFGVNGKFPFTVSKTVTLFPLLGVEYDLYLLAHRDGSRRHPQDAAFPISNAKQDAKALEALSVLGFKAGIGIDVALTERIFLRTELLYGIRLNSATEKYLLTARSDAGYALGHGGDFRVAVGYKF